MEELIAEMKEVWCLKGKFGLSCCYFFSVNFVSCCFEERINFANFLVKQFGLTQRNLQSQMLNDQSMLYPCPPCLPPILISDVISKTFTQLLLMFLACLVVNYVIVEKLGLY